MGELLSQGSVPNGRDRNAQDFGVVQEFQQQTKVRPILEGKGMVPENTTEVIL